MKFNYVNEGEQALEQNILEDNEILLGDYSNLKKNMFRMEKTHWY